MKIVDVSNHIICQYPEGTPLGYFGWPSVTVLPDGSLATVASGFRDSHICPFGKTVFWTSLDGETWSKPEIITSLGIDVRDAGITTLFDGTICVSCFTSDTRIWSEYLHHRFDNVTATWTDELTVPALGSFLRIRNHNGKWGPLIPVPVTSPHGPTRLRDGSLFYLGGRFGKMREDGKIDFSMTYFLESEIVAMKGSPDAQTWKEVGILPVESGAKWSEPYVIEIDNGTLLAMLRRENYGEQISIWQCHSNDGGMTWSKPEFITFGAPAHLLRTSSGILILSYGFRLPGYGQRVRFSEDNGKSWSDEWILRDDGPTSDLGYPTTAELPDGTFCTVYYQAEKLGMPCGIHASKWKLPR